jgi:hypothetical protein
MVALLNLLTAALLLAGHPAFAVAVDQTWVSGVYDDADFDGLALSQDPGRGDVSGLVAPGASDPGRDLAPTDSAVRPVVAGRRGDGFFRLDSRGPPPVSAVRPTTPSLFPPQNSRPPPHSRSRSTATA